MKDTELEAYRLIYSLEYRVEDVNTTTGNVLSTILPVLEKMAAKKPKRVCKVARQLLEDIGEKPLSEADLRECFPRYCELIGVEFEES